MDGLAKTVAPTVVNGIDLDDLFALIEGVKTDPAKGKTRWRVSTTWQGQTRSRAEVEGFGARNPARKPGSSTIDGAQVGAVRAARPDNAGRDSTHPAKVLRGVTGLRDVRLAGGERG